MSLCPSVHICFLMVCCALCQSSYSAEGNTEAGLVSRKPGEIKLPNSNPVEGVDKKKKISGILLYFPHVSPKSSEY